MKCPFSGSLCCMGIRKSARDRVKFPHVNDDSSHIAKGVKECLCVLRKIRVEEKAKVFFVLNNCLGLFRVNLARNFYSVGCVACVAIHALPPSVKIWSSSQALLPVAVVR